MDPVDLLRSLLLNDSDPRARLFDNQEHLAKAIAENSEFTPKSAKSGLSRLFSKGDFSDTFRDALINAALTKVTEGDRGRTEEQLRDAFKTVESSRARSRVREVHEATLSEVYAAAGLSSSLLVSYPVVPLDGNADHTKRLRREIANRIDLMSERRHRVDREWCFASRAGAFTWLYWLTWESAYLLEGGIPSRKTAEEMMRKIASLQEAGKLYIKTLRPATCLVHSCLFNVKGSEQVDGYIWHYDSSGRVQDPHRIEGKYLALWSQFADGVIGNDPTIVTENIEASLFAERVLRACPFDAEDGEPNAATLV